MLRLVITTSTAVVGWEESFRSLDKTSSTSRFTRVPVTPIIRQEYPPTREFKLSVIIRNQEKQEEEEEECFSVRN